jgi:hypothetical protein
MTKQLRGGIHTQITFIQRRYYKTIIHVTRHKFLARNFLGIRQICGRLFRPKLYTNGLSWQTISWYYPFKAVFKLFWFFLRFFLLSSAFLVGIVTGVCLYRNLDFINLDFKNVSLLIFVNCAHILRRCPVKCSLYTMYIVQ